MGSLSIWHWLIVLVVVLVLFGGGGKISTIMGDMAKGIKSFKKHMADDEPMDDAPPRAGSVAYTHLTRPPLNRVEIWGGAGSLKKQG
ncbi:MAG: twin-arginine translocase TatA/TatE family subunit, partial [Acetobacter sp.]|uniref:twin-arginine translocase TatA/TatE family subunit n=2 Tax=Acetobacter sp. TaxID=440 RepID=UPI0039ECED70